MFHSLPHAFAKNLPRPRILPRVEVICLIARMTDITGVKNLKDVPCSQQDPIVERSQWSGSKRGFGE